MDIQEMIDKAWKSSGGPHHAEVSSYGSWPPACRSLGEIYRLSAWKQLLLPVQKQKYELVSTISKDTSELSD